MALRGALAAALLLTATAAVGAGAPGPMSSAARPIFDRSKDAVLQLRAIHKATQAQAAIGSGFIASPDGLVVTNYHVVAQVALEPELYAMEFVRTDATRGPLDLLAVDVLHDLAVLRMNAADLPFLKLRDGFLRKGDRGYAMGNPHDLGLTIVEGTYNGYAEHELYPRIHFTGAINPGMSGGPALAQDGRVFGVNVSGLVKSQLVTFLVPAEYATKLLTSARARHLPLSRFQDDVRVQLTEHGDMLMQRLISAKLPVARFGRYEAPDSPAPFVRCWGYADPDPTKPYEFAGKACSSSFSLFVTGDLETGKLRFLHMVFRSRRLGALRFAGLMANRFGAEHNKEDEEEATKREFTGYRCHDDFVTRDVGTVRAFLCVRGYQRFEGLYDIRLRALTLNSDSEALLSHLELNGVGYEKGLAFARKYLEAIAWTK